MKRMFEKSRKVVSAGKKRPHCQRKSVPVPYSVRPSSSVSDVGDNSEASQLLGNPDTLYGLLDVVTSDQKF